MAEFLESKWYNGSNWAYASTTTVKPSSKNVFGFNSRDKTDIRRIYYKMDFGTLPANKKRTTITISETIEYTGPTTASWQASSDKFRFILVAPPTNGGEPYIGANPNGTIVAQADTSTFNVYKDGSFTIKVTNMDISGVGSGIYYLWIYSIGQNDPNTFAQYRTGDNNWPDVSGGTEIVDAFTLPTIKSCEVSVNSKTYYKPGEKFTIKWKGEAGAGSNDITKYQVGIQYGSKTWKYEDVGLVTSKEFEISSDYRGQSIKTHVRAIGEQSGFTDGAPFTLSIGTVNSLPSKPSITNKNSLSSAITGTQSLTFQVSPGSDGDGQSYSVRYGINISKPTTDNTEPVSSTLTLTGKEIGGGDGSINFFTYDGLEFSSAEPFSISVTLKPEFNGEPTFHKKVVSGNNGTEELIKSLSITYALTAEQSSPILTVYYAQASSISAVNNASQQVTSNITWDGDSKIELSEDQIGQIITAGNYFKIGFKISNSDEDSETKWSSETFHRAKEARGVSSISIGYGEELKDSDRHSPNYFKNIITVTVKNPTAGSGYADISSVQVYCGSKNNYAQTGSGAETTLTFDFSSSNEQTVNIQVVLKDTLERETSLYGTTQNRAQNPVLEGATPTTNPTTIKPLSSILNNEVVLTHPKGDAKGSTSLNYEYKITVGTKSSQPITSYTPEEEGDNTIKIHITASEIKRILNLIFPNDPNAEFSNSYFTVTAVDAFGGRTSIDFSPISINYIEAPQFVDSSITNIEIGHDYYINNTENWRTTTYNSISGNESANSSLRMFNPGEGIIIKIPKIKDLNLNDKLEYRFYISRNPLIDSYSISTSPKNLTYTNWFILSQEEVKKLPSSDKYYFHRYTASSYTTNQYFYFRLDVVDTTGQVLSCYSNTYILGCRVTKPKMNISVNPIRSEDGKTLTLDTKISLADLGGSALESWDVDYYNSFKNLERNLNSYGINFIPELKITLQVNDSPSSWNSISSNMERTYTINSNLAEFQLDEQPQFEVNENAKIFYRYSISVRYGISISGEYVYTIGDYYINGFAGNVPTMSHRPHWIGINTNKYSPDTNEAFVVENYSTKNQVVLRSSLKTIIIYLEEGKIEGYDNTTEQVIASFNFGTGVIDKATINGGTW